MATVLIINPFFLHSLANSSIIPLMNSSDLTDSNSLKDLFLFTFEYVIRAYMKNPKSIT